MRFLIFILFISLNALAEDAGNLPCSKEQMKQVQESCKKGEQEWCFWNAVCLGKEGGDSQTKLDNFTAGIKLLSKLCKSKFKSGTNPSACEVKAAFESDLPGLKAQVAATKKSNKDETEYQQIISSWNSLNTIEKMSGALKKLDRLCAINHSNSCENRDILKTSVDSFQKSQTTPQANATLTLAEEEAKCENGHGETCWGLFLKEKIYDNAYRFVKAGCSVGHEKSCEAKRIFDEELRGVEQRLPREKNMTAYLLAFMMNVNNAQPVIIKNCIKIDMTRTIVETEKQVKAFTEMDMKCERIDDRFDYQCLSSNRQVYGRVITYKDLKDCKSFPGRISKDMKNLLNIK